jgi:hypothetical protein
MRANLCLRQTEHWFDMHFFGMEHEHELTRDMSEVPMAYGTLADGLAYV